MREIKFRVWDKETKSLMKTEPGTCFEVGKDEILRFFFYGKELEITQFTGLKDKNGKEIYEGDIIEYKETNWVVRFEMGSFSLFTNIESLSESLIEKPKTDNEALADELGVWWTRCKVIGNKFENPELLK